MNADDHISETMPSVNQSLPTTDGTRNNINSNKSNSPASLRRSLRSRKKANGSSSPLTRRLLHRTNSGNISAGVARSGHQRVAPARGTNNTLVNNRQAVAAANSDVLIENNRDNVQDVSFQQTTTNPNVLTSLSMDTSSDDDTTPNPQLNNPRSVRSVVFEYFIEEDDGFRCKLCKLVYQASQMSDANLRLHLGTKHNLRHFLFPSQQKSTPTLKQTLSNERRAELDQAAINCIIEDSLPFGAFRRRGMAQFLAVGTPGYFGPNRKTVRRRLGLMYKNHRVLLRKILAKSPWIALTTDTWLNTKRQRFICLTGHFYTKSFEHVSVVLGFRRIVGRSVGNMLRSYIQHELRRLNISDHQIISITTDGGSDIRNAVSYGQFGQPISCLAHVLHLVVTKGLCLWKKPDEKKFPLPEQVDDEWIDDDGDESCDGELVNTSDEDGEYSDNDQPNESNLELVLDDDDKEDDNESKNDEDFSEADFTDTDDSIDQSSVATDKEDFLYNLLLQCHNVLMRIRSTIKFIRNNGVVHNYVRSQRSKITTNDSSPEKEVVLDLRIRWNSTYRMLCRFLWHKDLIKTIVTSPEKVDGITKAQMSMLKKFVFTHEEWDLIHTLQQVLEPFVIATKVLSGRRYPTIGLSMLVCRNLALFLQQNSSDHAILFNLKKSLAHHLIYYINGKMEGTQKQFMLIAAFLQPDVYCRLTEDERKLAKKQIMHKLKSTEYLMNYDVMVSSTQQGTTTNSSITTTANGFSTSSSFDILDEFANICGLHVTTNNSPQTSKKKPTFDEELSLYVAEAKHGGDFQLFWNKNMNSMWRLSQLAQQYCIIPASSVASEAAFSQAGYIQRKERSSLSSKALQYTMVLKDRSLVENLASSMA